LFFAVGIEGETELESERVTTLENQPTPGEKTTAQLCRLLLHLPGALAAVLKMRVQKALRQKLKFKL